MLNVHTSDKLWHHQVRGVSRDSTGPNDELVGLRYKVIRNG